MKRLRDIKRTSSSPCLPTPQVVPKPYTGPLPPFSVLVHPEHQSQWDKSMQQVQEGISKHGDYQFPFEVQAANARRKQLNDDGLPRYGYQLPPETDQYSWKLGDNPRINPGHGEQQPQALLRVPKIVEQNCEMALEAKIPCEEENDDF